MGLDANATRLLFYGRKAGVDFSQTAMIGRQNVFLSKSQLRYLAADFGISLSSTQIVATVDRGHGYPFAEPLLDCLGAEQIDSFDNSAYEGATVVHDFNQPLPSQYDERYSVVIDSGSLEHVFNFPVAIANCMRMLRIGGHFLSITPANNQFGHGFYQFSAELFFSVFNEPNGFHVMRMFVSEAGPDKQWYSVAAPAMVGQRVELCNDRPTVLMTIAQKIDTKPVFAAVPQQSDYAAAWNRANDAEPTKGRVRSMVPEWVKPYARRFILRDRKSERRNGFDPRFFTPVDPRSE